MLGISRYALLYRIKKYLLAEGGWHGARE